MNVFKYLSKLIHKRKKRNFRKELAELNLSDRFRKIYKINYWNNSESLSGQGSTLSHTLQLRETLPEIFRKYQIQSVFDAPCGDFNWMRHVVANTNISYIGADIVPELVADNQTKYSKENIQFIELDLTRSLFPNSDLMICRDCLFHLSFEDTKKLLKNFLDSNIEYLLTTTYENKGLFINQDILSGHFRLIDLTTEPYNLRVEPLEIIDDWLEPDHKRYMYL